VDLHPTRTKGGTNPFYTVLTDLDTYMPSFLELAIYSVPSSPSGGSVPSSLVTPV